MSGRLNKEIAAVPRPTPEERRRASIACACRALDREDLLLLLTAIGLTPGGTR
jgi:hypothetical protein